MDQTPGSLASLWVGLGNPEPAMARNRHNIGFMALDSVAIRHGFSPWRQRFKGLMAEGTIAGQKIIALKPMTYMNASGESVQPAAAFFKIPPPGITVFHDDLDLAPGKIRVKIGGGAAGHNGLRSIAQHLATPEFWRVRLGIGHPGDKSRVLGYVLGDFSKDDMPWLLPCLDAVANEAALLTASKPDEFMSRVAAATKGVEGQKDGL
jgi:PTH1 family peptidyl-tRNA hydrolase